MKNGFMKKGIRIFAGAMTLAGAAILMTPDSAWAAETNCISHIESDGANTVHTTCCTWGDDGKFQGCTNKYESVY